METLNRQPGPLHSAPNAARGAGQLAGILRDHPRRWLIPAIAVTLLAGAYALVRPATWEASQALTVRNEASGPQDTLGRFSQPEEMKTVQETILELSKSHSVLSAALKEVGPPALETPAEAWPTAEDVADLRDAMKLTPPKGAEFGKTEVFYVKVRDNDQGRAVALVNAVSAQLQSAFQKLRDAKAKSMVAELEKTVSLATDELDESTRKLGEMERHVGSDLAELRILHDTTSGESALRRTATEIRNELRQVRTGRKTQEQLSDLLQQSQREPERLVATPSPLLDSQPALRKLKDGLIEAQLQTAQLQGRMSAEHPLVIAAKESQAEIRRRVHEELPSAVRALEVDLQLGVERAALLEEQLADVTARLDKLAVLRAPYTNQVAETRNRSELLDRARQRLVDARASQATSQAAQLISRIDAPDPGTRPIGPGRLAIILIGLAGGLLTGFGVLLLTVEPQPAASSWSYSPNGAATAAPVRNGNGHSHGAGRSHAGRRSLSVKEALQRLAVRERF